MQSLVACLLAALVSIALLDFTEVSIYLGTAPAVAGFILLGAATGSPFALAFVILPVVLAVPFGTPASEFPEPAPIAVWEFVLIPAYAASVILGLALRWGARWALTRQRQEDG